MKTNNKGFCVFYDWVDDLDHLDGESAWKIIKAICEYHRHGVNPVEALDGPLRTVAAIMFHQIKRTEIKAAAGRKGAEVTNQKRFADSLPTAERRHTDATETITETITNNQSLFLSGASAHGHARESEGCAEALREDIDNGADALPDTTGKRSEDEITDDDDDEWLQPEARDKLAQLLKEQLKQKYLGGTLGQGVVMMNELQFSALCEDLSLEELDKYMRAVADCEKRGKHYRRKTHYQAILDMAAEDRQIQERNTHYGR